VFADLLGVFFDDTGLAMLSAQATAVLAPELHRGSSACLASLASMCWCSTVAFTYTSTSGRMDPWPRSPRALEQASH
jgi:hypothetical protein